jgi:hypothetical protein
VNLIDAIRLKAGDRLLSVGNARETQDWTWSGSGTVVEVSDGGLIQFIDDETGGRMTAGYHFVREYECRRAGKRISIARATEMASEAALKRHDPRYRPATSARRLTNAERVALDEVGRRNGYGRRAREVS